MLRHFGSIHRISEATEQELTPFVGKKTAHEVVDHFARQRALAEPERRKSEVRGSGVKAAGSLPPAPASCCLPTASCLLTSVHGANCRLFTASGQPKSALLFSFFVGSELAKHLSGRG